MKRIVYPLVGSLLTAICIFAYLLYFDPLNKDVVIEIDRGYGLRAIASKLKNADIIRNEELFLAATFINGSYKNLKAGEYEFLSGESLTDIIKKLNQGRVRLRKITIPEGKNIYEISEILDNNEIADEEKFISYLFDSSVISSEVGLEADSLEGYLFPDTYYFPKNAGPGKVIGTMTDHFFNVFNELKDRERKSWLSDREIVILASMIEKETGHDSERDKISSVFHNRLRIGMKLDCDPTVIYGLLPDFDGNLTKKDLRSQNPYNTYTSRGLPPGPIANPGRESLEAAMNPADTNYLYFVSRGDSTHVFSENYSDHIRAVNKHIRNN